MEESKESKTEIISYGKLLEMLEGYTYYDKENIDYVYHKLNGNTEEAEKLLEICLVKNDQLVKKYAGLKPVEEIIKENND